MSEDIEPSDAVKQALVDLQRVQDKAASMGTELERPQSRLQSLGQDAPDMKIELARKRDAVNKMQEELLRAAGKVEKAMKIEVEKARRFLEPLQKQVKMMQEGIWTINLYLGRDEEIQVLQEGEPAAFDEPISVRQMVLSMDQECAALAERGGIDATEIQVFTKWLLEDEANLKQVFPEQRGVVVMVPRITEKDYGDPWRQEYMNQANATTYWLLRNGEKLWLMTTDMRVGTHLIPPANEFTRYFEKDRWGRDIRPGSQEWLDAEEAADGRKRHYMRIAMVLQGLVDRTTVFHPMVPGISFLTPDSYDSGSVRVITDAERAIGDGLEPFLQWHARITKEMRPGMRIIGAFDSQAWHSANREDEYDRKGRLSVRYASQPISGEIYTLESSSGRGLKFIYQRTDKRWGYETLDSGGRYWGRYGEWDFARKGVSCTVYPSDKFMIPLDLVTVPEMERYLTSRGSRKDYVDMLPLLRAAIEAKQAEANAEAPFRQLVISNLMKASGDDAETIETQLDDLIRWFKLGNRWHRALVGQTREQQTHALLMINAEYMRRRVAHRDDSEESRLIAKVKLLHPTVAFIGRYHDGTYISYEPQAGADKTDSVGVYFSRRRWTKTGKAKGAVEEWICPKVAKMRPLLETDDWKGRSLAITERDRMTGPEFDQLVEKLSKLSGAAVVLAAAKRDNGSFYVVKVGTAPKITEETNLLTDNFPYFPVKYASLRDWKRTKDGITFHRDDDLYWHTSNWYGERHKDGDWNFMDSWAAIAWKDEKKVGKINADYAEYMKWYRRYSEMTRTVNLAFESIDTQWVERAKEREYEEFLAEYKDPDLWEGHQKTLNQNRFRFPYKNYSNTHSSDKEPFLRALEVAVEHGIQIDGMLVSEIVTLAKGFGLKFDRRKKVDFPDDVMAIRIMLKLDDEDVDEDE